jgi:capsular polysaccharide biosynthesis protein
MSLPSSDLPVDASQPFLLVLRRLYERKIRIVGVTVGVGVLVALLSLLIPNRYTSTTALMVKTPSVKVTGETPPLDIEVLREIVESDQVQYSLYTTMTLQGVVPKDEQFRSFKKNLKVSVRRKQDREQSLLPVVLLSVETKDSLRSKQIADEWKALTEKRVSRMYESDRNSLSQFVDIVSKQADDELLRSEKAYTLAVLKDQLPIKREWMKTIRSQYNSLFRDWAELDLNIRVQENLLRYYEERLRNQTVNNAWIGNYAMRRFWEDEKLTTLTETTTESQPTVASAYALVRSQRTLSEFEMKTEVAFKKLELDSASENLKEARKALMAAQDEMANAKTQYESLLAAAQDEPAKLVLNKAITDDALWEVYVQGKGTVEPSKVRERAQDGNLQSGL